MSAPLERSIWNTDPLDEFACVVADFIWVTVTQQEKVDFENIEIEAKIGRIVYTETGERVELPVNNETIIRIGEINARFESSMSEYQHAGYNALLNSLSEKTNRREYTGAKVSYEHLKETDYFYSTRDGKIRLTRNAKTGEIKKGGIVVKTRLSDLNVYCPLGQFDYRISVNVETPAAEPASALSHDFSRNKDRLSYAHQIVQVDLTQVSDERRSDEKTHELEVEFRNARALLELGHVSRSAGPTHAQDWHPFEDQVLIFLNTVRLLIKNCPPRH